MPGLEDGDWDEQIEQEQGPSDNGINSTEGPGDPDSIPTTTEPHQSLDEPFDETSEEEDLPEFDPSHRLDFEGLLYLGKLTDTFTWLGHKFVIRTLTVGEILEVGLIHREHVGTLAEAKAYQAAVTAACVVSVDGKQMPVPLTNEKTDTLLINRFEYVLNNWFPPTLDAIYERYLLLEDRVQKVIDEMGKGSGRTESMSTLTDTSV